jgi:hypothetical protein
VVTFSIAANLFFYGYLVAFFPEMGGICYVSTRYGLNNNESYSVMFLDVNFTFLYFTGPWYTIPGTNISGPLHPFTWDAFFIVSFSDNSSELIRLILRGTDTDASFSGFGYPSFTRHTQPRAGVVIHELANDDVNTWRYLVSR